eukprot:Nitzschia sp. Nitz4//scaffold69_size99277//94479//96575//NITZ4_004652-RA/size99277-processed-gene-0.91-mRNA-1//-1//CDS//3329556772//6073//frame0
MTRGAISPRRITSSVREKRQFHNRAALALTFASILLLFVLSVVFQVDEPQHDSRWLEDVNSQSEFGQDDTDYSSYSCRYIYDVTPDPGEDQCQFARTCNDGDGVWAPMVFCRNQTYSTKVLFWALSPVIIVWMVTLFRLLGSTAEDFFSPSLEMFSGKLGLPPRFAGVTLLALGNGAADVSATISAIKSDVANGYKLSLGALTGAAMFVGGIVAGIVVLVAGGVPCRGALIRDIMALLVTVCICWATLASGEVGPETISLFLSLYAIFVLVVLVADIYHRTVVLPRLQAADLEDGEGSSEEETPSYWTRAITAFSNYDNPCQQDTTQAEEEEGLGITQAPRNPTDPDAPIPLHGQNGILHGTGQGNSGPAVHAPEQSTLDDDEAEGGDYSLLMDNIDQICVAPGTDGFGSSNWGGAFHDFKLEVSDALFQLWMDIRNDDLNIAEKIMLFFEFPFTIMRTATVPIPCDGYYNRAKIALSTAVSPFWFAYYVWAEHGISPFNFGSAVFFLFFWVFAMLVSLFVMRYAPGGDGVMALWAAVPLALYGFVVAATWIDYIADHLVSLLDFMGIVWKIPGSIMGLTVLAWGNSMGDLSANMTMARKGLANMAMTACFAGPVFNILVGLGFGFSGLSAKTGNQTASVSLSGPIVTGFVFVVLNCITILLTGLLMGKGRIEIYYGYNALALYIIYVAVSISLEVFS